MDPTSLSALVGRALDGDQVAWDLLVDRFAGVVWAVVRAHRLQGAEAADVAQATWLRLVEHLDRVREPEKLGGWLATTARNECLRALRSGARQVASGSLDDLGERVGATSGSLAAALLTDERDTTLWNAFEALNPRCQTLLRLLVDDAGMSYEEISEALSMPIGSIGPTRQRCLERLRALCEDAGISSDDSGST